jgi:hypothetical protein
MRVILTAMLLLASAGAVADSRSDRAAAPRSTINMPLLLAWSDIGSGWR